MNDYDKIVQALRDARLDSTLASLKRCVDDEARELARWSRLYKGRRDAGRAARKAAQAFYADEIIEELTCPTEVTPERVLSHRRATNVWAIASIMRREGCMVGADALALIRGVKP